MNNQARRKMERMLVQARRDGYLDRFDTRKDPVCKAWVDETYASLRPFVGVLYPPGGKQAAVVVMVNHLDTRLPVLAANIRVDLVTALGSEPGAIVAENLPGVCQAGMMPIAHARRIASDLGRKYVTGL